MLTGREIQETIATKHEEAQRLLSRGDFAAALSTLTAVEATSRKWLRFRNAWRLPRFLMMLGKAHAGLDELTAAEKNFQEAWKLVESQGPESRDTRDCARALSTLYIAMNKAEPGKGFDVKAAEWRLVLAELEATGTPRASS